MKNGNGCRKTINVDEIPILIMDYITPYQIGKNYVKASTDRKRAGSGHRGSIIKVHFKRLGSRVSHDLFNQYVFCFSKQCTYCKTNAIYT